MARTNEDCVVLGADLEGLVAAATLAGAGRTVHLVDDGAPLGGTAAAREFHPGHRAPGILNEIGLVRRRLLAPLALESLGLAWSERPSSLHVLGGEQGCLALPADGHDPADALGADAKAHASWRALLGRLSGLVEEIVDEAPPQAEAPSKGELLRLGKKALRLRTLGERDMLELMRVVTLPAWDWTEELFGDARLRAGLVAPILSGTRVGPRGAGTSALLILRECLRGVEPRGGLAALSQALVARCEKLGVQLHRGARARRILNRDRRVEGLELEDGSVLAAGVCVSAVDVGRTLLDLIAPGLVPRAVEREVLHWRTRGSSAVMLLAYAVPPVFSGCASAPARFITAGTPLELERCADALKYGELPEQVWLDARLWTSDDAGCAPTGAATLVVHVHGVPYHLRSGWDESARARLRGKALDALERVAPGARDAVSAAKLLTPPDLEREFGLAGGHLQRGELGLDQLWAQRPSLALSRYGTPLAGLFLGGAGSHPGGPFLGGAGTLAARAALEA